jgi:hypothetical protein
MTKNIYILIGILFFSGCVNTQSINSKAISQNNGEPKWLNNPQKEAGDKITAVGCARIHYKGVSAQKKLAVSRAIDEIATQVEVTVDNVSLRNRTNNSSSSSSSSLQSVNKVNLKTKIMAYYTKPDGEICAWVIKR